MSATNHNSDQAPLALTMGDPAGIAPEITVKTWKERSARALPPFFVIGDPVLYKAFDIPVHIIETPDQTFEFFDQSLPVLPEKLLHQAVAGQGDPRNAPAIIRSIERAVTFAKEGAAGAVITNPIHKAVLYESGFDFPGHTEFLGHLCGGAQSIMMLAIEGLRVVPLTVHIPLKDVATSLTTDLLKNTAHILYKSLQKDFGLATPHIAVAGLNPHAGENGTIGIEEQEMIIPAIDALKAEGLNISGPYPADTLFSNLMRQTYDAALCMYHDQALIPLKTLNFKDGVNITLGLPIIRTSPDHGTAFDIAGKGQADPASLIAAIKTAADMATAKN